MNRIKKNFLHQNISWIKVILFAVITAVLTAVLNLIPMLEDTSFQDIAINLECWILFAVFIIVNCEKWWEASLKTFVFFLISQPLIYLIEVPFNSMGFGIFQYYRYWFFVTILTLPGAAIAFLLKRRDWLSLIVLSVATAFLSFMAADYFWSVTGCFPHHLLSLIFCILLSLFFIFTFLDNKIHRGIGVAVVVVVFVVSLLLLKPITRQQIDNLPEGDWNYTIEDESVVEIHEESDNLYTVTAVGKGTTIVTFEDELGNIEEYCVTVTSRDIFINQIEE